MGLKVSLEKVAPLKNIKLEIGDIEIVQNLVIAPLYGDDSFKESALLVNEAIEKAKQEETMGKFSVTESRNRDFLTINNELSDKIFIAEGQIVEGDSQNRMAVYSTLLPSHAGEIYVPVRCVQRKQGLIGNSDYTTSGTVIMPALRGNKPDKTWIRTSTGDDSQHKTWDTITSVTSVMNRTRILSLKDIRNENYCDVIMNAKLDDYLDSLKKKSDLDQIGYVAAVGRSDDGFDLYTDFFGNQKHLSGLYQSLLTSVAFVAKLHNQDSKAKHKRMLELDGVNKDTFSDFLKKIAEANTDSVPKVGIEKHFSSNKDRVDYFSDGFPRRTVGDGTLYKIQGPVDGSILVEGEKYIQTFAKVILN